MEFVIKESSVWGDVYKARNPDNILRLTKKKSILQCYPFVDHAKVFAFKQRNQRGPAREEQTFLISYMNVNNFSENKEEEFIAKLNECGLTYHKIPCTYNGYNAYRILILDSEVILERVLELL